MAKKWKNKLKKQQKAHLIHEMIGGNNTPEMATTTQSQVRSADVQTTELKTAKVTTGPAASSTLLPEVERVKRDVKRIALIVVSILVILTAVALSDAKTGWVLKSANSIFDALNF